MINSTGPLKDRIKGFEHTPKAWKLIRKETEHIARDTIEIMEKGPTAERDEISATQNRLRELKDVMVDNIGDTHILTPGGEKWNDKAFLDTATVTAKAIGGIFGEVIPAVGASICQHPGGLGEAGKKPDAGGPLKVKTPMLDMIENNYEKINSEKYAVQATRGLNAALKIAQSREKVDIKEKVENEPGEVIRTFDSGHEIRAYSKPLVKEDYHKILQNDQFLFADTKIQVQNKTLGKI